MTASSTPSHPLQTRLDSASGASDEALLDLFLAYTAEKGLELYPAQEEAILELFSGKNVILNTPTGSGKSLVATALHFHSLSQGRRSVYTCPIKALVNEKFLALCHDFGAERVGMVTGDATVNRHAPILCCTAEILANIALHEGENAEVHDVIMDEFHYYGDRDRGFAWQVPLLTLPQSRFLLMSATLGNTAFFEEKINTLTGNSTVTVASTDRPVPLAFDYVETALDKTVETLLEEGKAPIYLVHFTQNACAQSAQAFTSLKLCTREEKDALAEALADVRFSSPYGREFGRFLRHGIGVHHAGLLPKYRILVEKLAQRGLLKLICGTDTLGVGVNVPIRTVVFTQLCKYGGEKTAILAARDFHQICGRAGRRGFDTQGWVVAQAPEHVVENLKLAEKAAANPKKARKFVRKKPPERGYVHWDEKTFHRLIQSPPEPLSSSFQISHGMLLQVLSRPGNGARAMKHLIRDCHETPAAKQALRHRAFQLFRALLDRGIIEVLPRRELDYSPLRVNVDLQEDFSLHQTLSLYLIDALQLLDTKHPDYALDLLSLVEAIVEDPAQILRRQLDKLKSEKLAEMKADGVEYEQRIQELESMEHPKPKREFIYDTFNAFAAKHPWVGSENIHPKSIAREMYENFRSFQDYVKDYDLHRIEGLLLRHLSQVYKTLVQTVPESAKIESVLEIEDFLGGIIREIDASLLEEWERLRHPEAAETPASETSAAPAPIDVTRNRTVFERQLRVAAFHFVAALSRKDTESLLERLDTTDDEAGEPWTILRLAAQLDTFLETHERVLTDPEARSRSLIDIERDDTTGIYRIQQRISDPDAHNDWALNFSVSITDSRREGHPVFRLLSFGPVTGYEFA